MVRRTIFNFQDRQYILEMNQNLTFHYVKKMAATALGIDSIDLKIFHNNQDFTRYEKEKIEALFGQADPIVFDVVEEKRHDTFDRILKIRLNQEYCKDHTGKYRYFYCRKCKKHLCSECILTGEHNGHEIIEKQDYLQSSKEIIAKFFTDMDLHYPKLAKESEEIRDAIIKSFGGLIKYLQELEDCLLKYVDTIEGNNAEVDEFIKKNYQNLKAACTEGLDIVKTKVSIEDMMLNDEIFLTVDDRIEAIKTIRQRFLAYINSKRDAYLGLEALRVIINSSGDIYNFLNGFRAKLKIDEMVSPFEKVDKQKVISEILDGVPEQNVANLRSNYKPHFNGYGYAGYVKDIQNDKMPDFDIKIEAPQKLNPYKKLMGQIIGNMKDMEVKTLVNASKRDEVKTIDFSGKKADKFHNENIPLQPIPLIVDEKVVVEERPSTPEHVIEEDIMYHLQHCPSCNKSLRSSNQKEENLYKSFLDKGYDHYICMPVVGTQNIKIFDVFSKQIMLKQVTDIFFKDDFYPGCSWYNYKDNLYVLGGINNGKTSKDFFKYNAENNRLERLTSIPEAKYGHSICVGDDNCLYVVGGNTKSIFKFDLVKGSWQKLPIFLSEVRYHPNVWINKNTLFVAFGEDEKTILPTIEKGKLNGKGNMDVFGKSEKYKRTYAGIVLPFNKDTALLIGGENAKHESLESTIEIDEKTGKVSFVNKKLDEANHFQQNYLMLIDQDIYGNFSMDGDNHFITFKYEV